MSPAGRSGYPSPGGRGWLSLTSALATLIVIAVLAVVAGLIAYKAPGPPARAGAQTTVILRKGAGVSEIAADLQRAGVVRSAPFFMAAAQLTGAAHALKAGEYAFPSRASLSAVIRKMRRGEVVHHRITIPEGLTSQQAVDILMKSPVLTGTVSPPPEGTLLPETYEVVRGESRAAVLQRMEDARDRLVSQLWAKRRPGLPYTSVDQAITLASIVEKETALPAERPKVAAVYLNRLRQGMKLDSDPTVIYGITQGAPLGHGLRASELQNTSPYNTYLNPGLPPGPIGNPGRASLAAVMDPAQTDELYFVANGTGGHSFSRTLEEQAKNVAKWREIEKQRKDAAILAGPPIPPPSEHR